MSGSTGTELGEYGYVLFRLPLRGKGRHLINGGINICVTATQISSTRKRERVRPWWCTPLIPAVGKRGSRVSEFEANLVYRVSFRTEKTLSWGGE